MRVMLYELNEVPWRVVDHYVRLNPGGNFARLVRESASFTTLTHDTGELHPWTTWPSLHRGVYNTEHDVRFLNQELDPAYPPFWSMLADQGVRCGIFGSLQSYPLLERDPEKYAFYVPDTFSPSASAWPARYTPFQRFNLMMTARDGAYAKPLALGARAVADLTRMTTTGLRPSTAIRLTRHLKNERRNPLYKTRRPILQAPVAFDFFKDAVKRDPPALATFFTNHVAGIMHRYWKYSFPEDFDTTVESEEDRFKRDSLKVAMDLADQQLGWLMAWCSEHGTRLVVASSMGQEAIDRGQYLGELRIEEADRFLRFLGFGERAESLLAMQPDFVFSLASAAEREAFEERIGQLRTPEGSPVFRIKRTETTVNLGLDGSAEALERRVLVDGSTGAEVPFEELGIVAFERDPGTGYHQPRGILMVWGDGVASQPAREEIDLDRIAPTLLSWFGVERPAYMTAPVEV